MTAISDRAYPRVADGASDGTQWVIGGCSRREARARAAAACAAPGWTLCLTPAALRPMREQCAAAGHPAEQCVCWRHGEDWYQRCAAGTPGAIAAWRIDRRARNACWRALRTLTARRARHGRAR